MLGRHRRAPRAPRTARRPVTAADQGMCLATPNPFAQVRRGFRCDRRRSTTTRAPPDRSASKSGDRREAAVRPVGQDEPAAPRWRTPAPRSVGHVVLPDSAARRAEVGRCGERSGSLTPELTTRRFPTAAWRPYGLSDRTNPRRLHGVQLRHGWSGASSCLTGRSVRGCLGPTPLVRAASDLRPRSAGLAANGVTVG
jgi:hypothetical protein